jgi:hypothetical protein
VLPVLRSVIVLAIFFPTVGLHRKSYESANTAFAGIRGILLYGCSSRRATTLKHWI